MNYSVRHALLLLSLFLIGGIKLQAQDLSVQRKLEAIQVKVDLEMKELKRLEREQDEVKADMRKIHRSLEDLKLQEAEQQAILVTLRADSQRLGDELEEVEERERVLRVRSHQRLRALYMHRSDNLLHAFVEQSSLERGAIAEQGGSFTSFYMSKVRSADLMVLDQLAVVAKEKEEKKEEIASTYRSQQDQFKKIEETKNAREVESVRKGKLVKSLESKERKVKNLLASLQTEALRLETVLRSLTEGTTLVTTEGRGELSSEEQVPKKKIVPFSGAGIQRSAKDLELPVSGTIVRSFGKKKHDEFADYVFHKGIEFSIEGEDRVRAVKKGKVLFASKMPVLGNIVILDHGARTYSLYGKLSELDLSVGDVVSKGEKFARVSESEEERRFYFEIRKDGKPVDPQLYYSQRLTVGAKFP